MGFSFVTEIPSPDVIRERFPLAPELAARKKERDEEIKKIITGESDKLLVFIVLVAAFSITNTLITTVIQKTREIGVLKSMGIMVREFYRRICRIFSRGFTAEAILILTASVSDWHWHR